MRSLDEIYREYSRNVYLFLLSKTGDGNLAEELTQETFFQAVQGIEKFKGNSSVLTWLCGIAQNIWLKYLRDHKTHQPLEKYMESVRERAAEDSAILRWETVDLLKRIHNLKEPVREVIYLRLIGNLSYAQIGEILGQSENWARVNFFRGRQMLVKEMKSDEK